MREEAVLFGKRRSLVGIMTDPADAERGRNLPALILLNAGIVHRVGPNRLYVKTARSLAAMGFVVLRCDFSGIGDSLVREDHLPFEKSAVLETQEAMDYLQAARGVERFLLLGLCGGAAISLKTASCDPRVVGTVLINFRGYHDEWSEALRSHLRARDLRHYYWNVALRNPQSWWRALTGRVGYRNLLKAVRSLAGSVIPRPRQVRASEHGVSADLRSLTERGVALLLIYSERDFGLDYLRLILKDELPRWMSLGSLKMEIIPQASHTFTLLRHQERVIQVLTSWADGFKESFVAARRQKTHSDS
jgi:pimeloyl-ACP methyl ester carboxylesterase